MGGWRKGPWSGAALIWGTWKERKGLFVLPVFLVLEEGETVELYKNVEEITES